MSLIFVKNGKKYFIQDYSNRIKTIAIEIELNSQYSKDS